MSRLNEQFLQDFSSQGRRRSFHSLSFMIKVILNLQKIVIHKINKTLHTFRDILTVDRFTNVFKLKGLMDVVGDIHV